jgi:hypothetical protein
MRDHAVGLSEVEACPLKDGYQALLPEERRKWFRVIICDVGSLEE